MNIAHSSVKPSELDPASSPLDAVALLEDLRWRGLVHQTTNEDELLEQLRTPTAFFVGFDPTASSLHMGSLQQLLTARRLQQAGHKPFILVGGGTGLIGDPKPGGERQLSSKDQVAVWTDSITAQVQAFVSFEGDNAAVVVNNADWLSPLSALDFLRDVGKHFSVNVMLSKDLVASRLESGISFTEFSFMLLQGLDFLELFKRHDVRLQIGGSDQWGNIVSGTELIRKSVGGRAHALTSPLLLKADGTKFGKTETGTVWLDPALTSPFDLFQFLLNAEDDLVFTLLKRLTFESRAELEALMVQHETAPHLRLAQRRLAQSVTALVHGEHEAELARKASEVLFAKDVQWAEVPLGVMAAALETADPTLVEALPSTLVDALVLTKLASSKADARRALKEGSIRVNGVAEKEDRGLSERELLHSRFLVLHRGRKRIGALDTMNVTEGLAHAHA